MAHPVMLIGYTTHSCALFFKPIRHKCTQSTVTKRLCLALSEFGIDLDPIYGGIFEDIFKGFASHRCSLPVLAHLL